MFAPDAPLLLEAEEWVNQRVMRFYPDIWVPSGPAAVDTEITNLLMALKLSWAWVARGDANDNLEEAMEDYRRAIRLGRLFSQEDFALITDRIGQACIRIGLESMLRRLQAEGDRARLDQVALALSQTINDRLTSDLLFQGIDVLSYIHAGRFSLSMDLPDWKLDSLATIALDNPPRNLRTEIAMMLCTVRWLGYPRQRRRAAEILEELARDRVRFPAEITSCSANPMLWDQSAP